jgi:hypothetical protein
MIFEKEPIKDQFAANLKHYPVNSRKSQAKARQQIKIVDYHRIGKACIQKGPHLAFRITIK